MLTISNPLSASQAQAYHAEEFGNARENYYTQATRYAVSARQARRAMGIARRSARGTFPEAL